MIRQTASQLQRIEACALSVALPQVHDTTPRHARDAGAAIHDFLRRVGFEDRSSALASVPEAHREACDALDVDSILKAAPDAWAQELALAWHPGTGVASELHRGLGNRDYSAAPEGALVGTADLVGLADKGERAVVLDLKTGWADLGPPEASLQLGFGAVAVAALHGCSSATVGFVRVVQGEGIWRTAELDALDLSVMAARLREVWEMASRAELAPSTLSPVMGSHCRYCPAFLRCPAQMSLARELGLDAELDVPLPDLEHEDVPAIIQRLERGEALLARIREHVEAYASSHPVRMPDGRTFGVVERTREGFDATLAAPVLEAMGLGAAVEVTREVTKESIKRAIQRTLPPLPRGTIKRTFEALREAGAATTRTHRAVDYVATERLPEGGT